MTLAGYLTLTRSDVRARRKARAAMNAQLSSDITDMRIEQMEDKATRHREQSQEHRSGRSD